MLVSPSIKGGKRPKPLLEALLGQAQKCPPFWFMRQAGRYLPEYRAIRAKCQNFLDLCYTPELAAEVTMQPVRRFGMDAAIVFSDILVLPHALGADLRFEEGGPRLHPIRNEKDMKALRLKPMQERLSPIYATLQRVSRELPEEAALIGFAGGPWTVACYLAEGGGSQDFRHARSWAYQEPESFSRLIALLADATADYLVAQANAGADALQIFDSWAGLLPENEFARWVIAPTRRIVERVRRGAPGIPIIGFPRGAGANYTAYAGQSGVDAVSLDQTVPLEWALHALGGKAALQGNLDPLLLTCGGETMLRRAEEITRIFRDKPFVFNLGHGITPDTPVEHVALLSERLRKYRPDGI